MKLARMQQSVVDYLRGKDWTSPSEIGREVWGPGHHSSTGSPRCKRLVEMGVLERNERGHYRLLPNAESEVSE